MRTTYLPFLLFAYTAGHAQKTMALPDSFLSANQQLRVKQKNIAGFPKYEIGDYAVVSGRSSWESITRKAWTDQSFLSHLFFTKEEKINIKEKSSFILTGPNNDSAFVTIATYTILSYSDASKNIIKPARSPKEYTGGLTNYSAIIQTNTDTTTWTLTTTITEIPKGNLLGFNERKYTFTGLLTDGTRQIALKEIDKFKDGKSSIVPGLLGLSFYEGDIVAAVQFQTGSFKKDSRHFAWLGANLNNNMQLILSSAIAALLSREAETEGKELDSPR
jgi:hypothetical protein